MANTNGTSSTPSPESPRSSTSARPRWRWPWIRDRPGVSSTLIGARTLDQLRSNLASLDVTLSAEQRATLDEVSAPTLPFPARFEAISAAVAFGGMTVDGTSYPAITVNGKQRRGEY